MRTLTWERLRPLLNGHKPPCLSIYLPTHRQFPDNQQNPIRYKNLLRTLETSLRQKYPTREVRPLLEKFQTLGEDEMFWAQAQDGLAVLGSGEEFQVHRLQRRVPELAVAADSFHIKPLIRYVQSADRYQVLCLDRTEAKLYQGNRYALDSLDLNGFPATLTAALGTEVTERMRNVVSHTRGGNSGYSVAHGHGTQSDDIANDTERFFRVIDREVLARFSKPANLPLVLVSLPEHQSTFRALSQNPHLLAGGVTVNPSALSQEQLRQEVWKAVEPQYHERLAQLCEDFRTAQKREKGSSDLSDAARAAVAGRIGRLLIESERLLPGRIDDTGAVHEGKLGQPDTDDLLDDLAEQVLRCDGEVVIVPTERMPSKTGLAAIYRY